MYSAKLKAVLIDDESNALKVLSHLLIATCKVEVVAMETNPNIGLRQIVVHTPDVVFLDVDMPQKDGITLLKEIHELDLPVKVVMVSAYDNFIFDAFKSSAVDFLLKPIVMEDLCAILQRLQSAENNKDLKQTITQIEEAEKIKISDGGKTLLLEPEQILFITADGNYSNITLKGGKVHLITLGIGKLEKQLPQNFFRVSRSVIINTQRLTGLIRRKRTCIISDGEKEYPVKASGTAFYELEGMIS
ncbi:DNA-binding response regulator [Marinilabiliaceae bacterium JC017]|nr:DNA-binding response regulator [Marinilabiliaceae bacterium JC017]